MSASKLSVQLGLRYNLKVLHAGNLLCAGVFHYESLLSLPSSQVDIQKNAEVCCSILNFLV
jgi:hypothetical protein